MDVRSSDYSSFKVTVDHPAALNPESLLGDRGQDTRLRYREDFP